MSFLRFLIRLTAALHAGFIAMEAVLLAETLTDPTDYPTRAR